MLRVISILSLLMAYGAQAQCIDLRQGQARKIRDTGTGVAAKYTLFRLADVPLDDDFVYSKTTQSGRGTTVARFEALVKPVFANESRYRSSVLQQKWERRAQECYDAAAPKMRGPHGEFMRIALSTSRPFLIQPDVVPIIIRPSGSGSSVGAWGEDANCALIVHETLHLLGLVDEYKPRTVARNGENYPEFSCRAIGPDDSIMAFQDLAYAAVGLAADAKPAHSRSTLLLAGEFLAIARPLCRAENSLFLSCASQAYSRSYSEGHDGCFTETPEACYVSSDWVHSGY